MAKNQKGKSGNPVVGHVAHGNPGHGYVRAGLHCMGNQAETETTTDRTIQNLTVEEIEVKVGLQILRQLEMLNLQQLIDTLEFINDLHGAREDVPLDLSDIEVEG